MWNRLAGLGTGLLLAGCAAAAPPIEGDYLEDRTNRVHGCYCEWSGEGVTSGKEVVVAWRFRSGAYQGTPLAGVKVAAVLKGETNLSIGNPPRKSVLFLDKAAAPAQRQAAERLMRASYARLLGEIASTHVVEMEFERTAERAVLRIPSLLTVEIRKAILPEDALQGSITWFDPFIPLDEFELGTTLDTEYTGREFDLKWKRADPGTNSYFGTFTLPVS